MSATAIDYHRRIERVKSSLDVSWHELRILLGVDIETISRFCSNQAIPVAGGRFLKHLALLESIAARQEVAARNEAKIAELGQDLLNAGVAMAGAFHTHMNDAEDLLEGQEVPEDSLFLEERKSLDGWETQVDRFLSHECEVAE